MWFEILPACILVGGPIAAGSVCIIIMNKLVFGNMYTRSLTFPLDRRYFLRDKRLTNNPYKQNGLETIKDDYDKPKDDGGRSGDICKLRIETCAPTSSKEIENDGVIYYTNNGSKPPQDVETKDTKDQRASVKSDVPDNEKPKKNSTESQLEMKKNIIGSAGYGGPAEKEPNRENYQKNSDR